MQFTLSDEQHIIVDSFGKLFAEATHPSSWPMGAMRFDQTLWRRLADLGAPLMRYGTEHGGSSLGLFDALLVAEQAGRYMAAVPLAETICAMRAISGLASPDLVHNVAKGETIITFALRDITEHRVQIAPAAAISNHIVVQFHEALCLWTPRNALQAISNLGGFPLAKVDFDEGDLEVLAVAPDGMDRFRRMATEWQVLRAGQLIAVAKAALESAAAYSCERIAFGKQIGAYQGIAHSLADAVVDVDGGQLLLWRAVAALERETDEAAKLLHMACWWARSVAVPALERAMRVFGGYGVSLEQNASRYYRWGRALTLIDGDPDDDLDLIAAYGWEGRKTVLPTDAGVVPDFTFNATAKTAADQAHAFFDQHLSPELKRFAEVSDDGHDAGIQRDLASNGLLFPHWQEDFTGDDYVMAAIRLASGEAGWNMTAISVTDLVGKILLAFGSPEVKRDVLPRLMAGEANCALGYTEPSGGSDVFAAETKAVQQGDVWRINGQKIFTSQGHLAEYTLLIARTDVALPKHKGLTLFLIPLDQPGYSCTAIDTLGGERTNTTFYSDILVSDAYRVGEINGGNKVLAAALLLEQNCGFSFVPPMRRAVSSALKWGYEIQDDGNRPIERRALRHAVARGATRIEVLDSLSRRALCSMAQGENLPAIGPEAKLFGSESWVLTTRELVNATAPDVLLIGDKHLGILEREARKAHASTIYGGTSEIQRSLIAENRLQMPRSRK